MAQTKRTRHSQLHRSIWGFTDGPDHAQAWSGLYQWWGERVNPSDGSKGLNPNSANRDIGNVRTLFKSYWVYQGDHNWPNPFKGLNYTENHYKDIPAFENYWVRNNILVPGLFHDLNQDARLIIYALIETGCRPNEIANLRSEHIKLNANVPHIQNRPRENRQLKTNLAIRDIPLTGISLEAMGLAPFGFPCYILQALCVEVKLTMGSADVLEALYRLLFKHGKPKYIRSDNDSEFLAVALQLWLHKIGIKPIQIYLGSPWERLQ